MSVDDVLPKDLRLLFEGDVRFTTAFGTEL